MELKRCSRSQFRILRLLLIVPYGIETGTLCAYFYRTGLLIVPYGIETIEVRAAVLCVALLIVPYGIET